MVSTVAVVPLLSLVRHVVIDSHELHWHQLIKHNLVSDLHSRHAFGVYAKVKLEKLNRVKLNLSFLHVSCQAKVHFNTLFAKADYNLYYHYYY